MKPTYLCKAISLAVLVLYSYSKTLCQEPRWKWAKTASNATVLASETDTVGNVVAIGQFTDISMQFGNSWTVAGTAGSGNRNMFIVKYNPAGGVIWAQSVFGTSPGSQVDPVEVHTNEKGDIAVMCVIRKTTGVKIGKYTLPLKDTLDNLAVVKLGKNGRIHWIRIANSKSDGMNRIKGADLNIDNFGNVYCTGSFIADSLFFTKDVFIRGDSANALPFIARFNALGILSWAKTCGFEKTIEKSRITSRFLKLSLDGILIAGDYQGKREYYFGLSVLPRDSTLSGFVAKLGFDGTLIWARPVLGQKDEFIEDVAVDLAGNVYITGLFNSPSLILDTVTLGNSSLSSDVFVARLNPSGRLLWLRNINTQLVTSDSIGKNVFFHVDLLGNVILVAQYMGTSILSSVFTRPNVDPGTRDLFMIKLENTSGNIKWVRTGNSVGDDLFNAVTYDRYGSLYMLGVMKPNVTYDSLNMIDNTGAGGFYILKINSKGQIKYVKPNLNSAGGLLTGQRLNADQYGNVYMMGNFSGSNNQLGNIDVQSPEPEGLFVSKFSYISDISGTVLNNNGTPMTGGMVKLYGFTRFQRSPLSDSAVIGVNGEFLLKDIPYGRYIIYAYPSFNVNPNAAPTYYPSASNWDEATPVLVISDNPVTGINIQLKETPVNSGTSTLGGMIYESDTISVFKSTSAIQAKAVKKADVILVGKSKSTDNVIAYTTTDDYGDFAFNDVPQGSYTIITDIPGMPHESYYDLTVGNGEAIMNLDYLVGEETITAENEITALPSDISASEDFTVYPNPSTGRLIIQSRNWNSDISNIRLFTLSGQCVYDATFNLNEQGNMIDLSSMPKGIYLLKIKSGPYLSHHKIVMR